jgi:hypothetical protein
MGCAGCGMKGFTSIRVIGDGQVYMLIEFALTIPEE